MQAASEHRSTLVDLVRDNGGVLSKKEGSGTVLPKLSKKASRSNKLQSKQRLISM